MAGSTRVTACRCHAMLVCLLCLCVSDFTLAVTRDDVVQTMKRATRYMVEQVSDEGGYVWVYETDLSRRWGELEAAPGIIWVQAPSTPGMGHTFLDAYAATGDEFYLRAARQVADVLVRGQHPAGGWNYFFHLSGEDATRGWYNTIGANAWRLEEFHHYYGNATFDDGGTIDSAMLILRLQLLEQSDRYRESLQRVVRFVLDSQQPMGGWPQRYPPTGEHRFHGLPDYSGFTTLNDDVALKNIQFLLACYLTLGREDLLEPIYRAMFAFLPLQLGAPQPGWALQYDELLQPAGARSYEPVSLSPPATAQVIGMLIDFYNLTGDSRFLSGVPAALGWLKALRLPEELIEGDRAYPRIVELGSNRPLFLHRRGSNVVNGEYFVDYNPDSTVIHYRSTGRLSIEELVDAYRVAQASKPVPLRQRSLNRDRLSHELIARGDALHSLIGSSTGRGSGPCFRTEDTATTVDEVIAGLSEKGYWPQQSGFISNHYSGSGSSKPAVGDYATTWVGDNSDTSTNCLGARRTVISTATYMHNMRLLLGWLK